MWRVAGRTVAEVLLEQPAGMVHSILTSGSLAEGLAAAIFILADRSMC